jgi:type 1 glutamine amidotransferase
MRRMEIAWTQQFGQTRVICPQPGHNNDAYGAPSFRNVLSCGILWAVGGP